MSNPNVVLSVPITRTVAAATIAILAMAACSPSASTPESAAENPAPSVAASEGGAQSGKVTVNISGRSFGSDITITAGSSVVFVNQDSVGHTVTNGTDGAADPDALFDDSVADGESTEIVFDTPGTYQVTCRIHASMHLTITVE